MTVYIQSEREIIIIVILTAAISLIAIFSHFAGVLTDVKFSRYKAVLCCSYSVIICMVCFGILYGAMLSSSLNMAK